MSVINKKPYIQSVIESLTAEQKSSLMTLVNGASTTKFRSFINLSYPITTDDKGVSHCVLETKGKVYTGYLLYNNTYCVLLAYDEFTQKITILNIVIEQDKVSVVNEYLDINELRRYLEETTDHITTGEIDSGTATSGQVLLADGSGGASWGNIPKQLYVHPIQLNSGEGTNIYRINCYVYNNSGTELTLATFKSYLDEVGSININGVYKDATKTLIVTTIYKSENYTIEGVATDGSVYSITNADFSALFPTATTTFIDGIVEE